MKIGEIDNISIKINLSFFLIAGLFVAAGMVKEVFLVFFSLLLHEAAHVFAAKGCGYRISALELLPFGGVATIEHFWEGGGKKVFAVAVSGPLCSFLLACLGFLSAAFFSGGEWRLIARINMMLACFNLLPAFPLDGGHLFRVFFMIFFSYRKSTFCVAVLSGAVSVCLLLKLTYDFIMFQTANLSFAVMILFILAAARREIASSGFHTVRVMAYKKADLLRRGYMETVHYTVEKHAKMKPLTKLFTAGTYAVILVVDKEYKICGAFTEIEVWEALAENGMEASFADLLP